MTTHVGLDVDGVVANFTGYYLDKLGLDPELNKTWDIKDSYGEEVETAVRKLLTDPATWVSLKPMDGAKEAVDLIRRGTGSTPVFISSMPAEFIRLREWWLLKHFGKVLGGELYFYRASASEKPFMARQLMLTHFVEDKRTTANAIAMAGLESVLVPSTYMSDGGEPVHPKVRICSLMEFARDLNGPFAEAA